MCSSDLRQDDTANTEDTGFNNSHRVQQGRDRSRCDHRRRQPVVERHESRFTDTEDEQPVGQSHQPRMLGHDCIGEHSVDDVRQVEVQIADEYIGKHHGGKQEELGSTHQIDDVLACAHLGIRIFVMVDQRIREHGNNLVEEIEREYVGCESYADGTKNGDSEADIIPEIGRASCRERVLRLV